jgi:hypothetical protein
MTVDAVTETAGAPSVRAVSLRRWANRTVDARKVIMAAVPCCGSEQTLWAAIHDLTGPPRGVAQVVASRHQIIFSFGPRDDVVRWSRGVDNDPVAGTISGGWTEAGGRLYRRGVAALGRRGVAASDCSPVCQFAFEPASLRQTLMHPDIKAAVDAVRSLYTRSAAEATAICRAEGTTSPEADFDQRWLELEFQARRRLTRLMSNPRLAGL